MTDTVHDMGGMHGFGAVDLADGDAFHADWEKRVLGIRLASTMAGQSRGNLRANIEAIPAALYLSSTYYERWARGVEANVVHYGQLTEAEITDRADAIAAGTVARPKNRKAPDEAHDRMAAILAGITRKPDDAAARFKEGDRVTVRRMSPAGHTRCPRYVRGATGTVERVTGGYSRPDPGDHPVEQTYTVRFDLRDLWGNDAEAGQLYIDLWEGYLE